MSRFLMVVAYRARVNLGGASHFVCLPSVKTSVGAVNIFYGPFCLLLRRVMSDQVLSCFSRAPTEDCFPAVLPLVTIHLRLLAYAMIWVECMGTAVARNTRSAAWINFILPLALTFILRADT